MRRWSCGVIALLLVAACGGDEPAAEDVLRGQQWSQTIETVSGLPIGNRQVELEKGADGEREQALETLRARKKVLGAALESPPELSDLVRRQAAVETYLTEEFDVPDDVRDKVKKSELDTVRSEIIAKLRKPKGFVATVVTLQSDEMSRDELLEKARAVVGQLGPDPSDDEIQDLEGSTGESPYSVEVEYAVPFPSVVEATMRLGWTRVSSIGAGEVESLSGPARVTSAYTVDDKRAQFMVKLAEIPAEEADEAEVERLIDEQLALLSKRGQVGFRVDDLVERRPWTIYPAVLEDSMELK